MTTTRLPRQLTEKHHDLMRERVLVVARVEELDRELAALEYAIRVLDPEWEPPPRTQKEQRPPRLPVGVLSRDCVAALRQHGEMWTPEVVALVAKRRHIQFADRKEELDFASAVAMALRRYERQGFLETTERDPSTPSITLEPVADSGFEALVAIRVEAMRESLERIGRFDPVRARERFRSGFSPEHTKHIVARAQQVGFVVTKPQELHLPLDHLYVRPAHQGRGIGARVRQLVFAQAESLRLPVKVGALRESDSNRFYARHGFRLVEQGEFDNYYLHQAQSAP